MSDFMHAMVELVEGQEFFERVVSVTASRAYLSVINVDGEVQMIPMCKVVSVSYGMDRDAKGWPE